MEQILHSSSVTQITVPAEGEAESTVASPQKHGGRSAGRARGLTQHRGGGKNGRQRAAESTSRTELHQLAWRSRASSCRITACLISGAAAAKPRLRSHAVVASKVGATRA